MVGFENLRKQLALAVRCHQWSYAIFWSMSITQPRFLEWGSGYYNGDIKTRKTTQSEELNADLVNSQRSDQLRELYESLAAGESNSQARRPSAALSPEDLTDTEWYYLVCMSFVFDIGQGLPGKTFESGQPIWLSNADIAESKQFSRSLLAKSSDIQTVACFPFFGGVVEMGVTELVPEDMNLIEQVKASFLDILPQPIVADISLRNRNLINDDMDLAGTELDHDHVDGNLDPIEECEELDSLSLDNSSSEIAPDQVDDSVMITGGASQVQSWHFVDDEDFSNCVHNSSDCVSQTFAKAKKSALKMEKLSDCYIPCPTECARLQSFDARSDDLHYQSVISTILKSSDQLGLGPRVGCCKKSSSFGKWNRVGLRGNSCSRPRDAMSQVMLKKVLFEVCKMHHKYVPKIDPDELDAQHLPPVTGQQDVLHEKFVALQSLVPTNDKVDKVRLLDATITYLKELEKKVQTLESSKESTDFQDTNMPMKTQDSIQQTSDSYKTTRSSKENHPSSNKRKASQMDQTELQTTSKTSKDGSSDNIYVSIVDNNVMIEMRCCWRECLLFKVMDAMSSLCLDSHSVQSSTVNGMLQLTIKAKFQGSRAPPSVGVIRQKLQRTIAQST